MDGTSRVLAGRYEVGELIGRGGMADVHIGRDTRLGRTVAIKVLRSDLARDPAFQARFRREAQAAAALNHPAIVAVYDTGEDVVTEQGGALAHVPFIVMEYVEGHTVRDILSGGTAVPIEEAVEITAGVLSALEYSHHAGIVHRDIKPANVMLTPTGAVKVMDFGIARAIADSAATMTATQAVIGTAQYLSPEQARGETVDARSDLYSTGCLLYEMLTGRPPFVGDSPVAVAYQHVREDAEPPSSIASDVPEALDRITMKALAKSRTERYSSAAEFRGDLEAAVRGGYVAAPPLGQNDTQLLGPDSTTVMPATAPPTAATQVLPPTQNPAARPVAPPPVSWSPPPSQAQPQVEEQEPPRRTWLLWLLIVLVLAGIGAIITLILTSDGNTEPTESVEPETVSMVNLAGMTESAATQYLDSVGLVPEVLREASDDVDQGLVIRSEPQGPAEVELGETVTVVVSTGPESVRVPELSGREQAAARQELERLGLQVGDVTTEDHPTTAAGLVIRTEPAADEVVEPGTEVALFVSSGQVQLPDLRGMTEDQAAEALGPLNLQLRIQEVESSEVAPGLVVSQSPSAGPVAQFSQVTITLAIEPTPSLSPTPSDEPTPTDEPTEPPTDDPPDDAAPEDF